MGLEDNPYQVMLGVMGQEAGRGMLPFVRTGVVVSLSPMMVQSGELLLDANDLLIDPRLLPRKRAILGEKMEGAADFPAPLGAGAKFAKGTVSLTAQLPGELAVGDRVVMVTADGEEFFILCKGVKGG